MIRPGTAVWCAIKHDTLSNYLCMFTIEVGTEGVVRSISAEGVLTVCWHDDIMIYSKVVVDEIVTDLHDLARNTLTA